MNLNEQEYAALTAQGYTGTLNEMEYQWLADQCIGAATPPVSNDPLILWGNGPTPITSYIYDNASVSNNLYFNDNGSGTGYWEQDFAATNILEVDSINGPFNPAEYLVKYEITEDVSGAEAPTLAGIAQPTVWVDAFRANLQLDDLLNDGIIQEKVLRVWMAADDGGGTPVVGSETWKMVRFISSFEDAP